MADQNFCFLDVDPNNMELITQFSGISGPSMIDNSSLLNFQNYFSSGNLLFGNSSKKNLLFGNPESDHFTGSFSSSIKQLTNIPSVDAEPISSDYESHENKNRKAVNFNRPENSSGVVPSHDPPLIKKKNVSGKRKGVKKSNDKEAKSKEVVHVRARRGQATSNHSLAERARRGKINERLRCLQAIVPGCYKSMGIAVVLDEIINYVQSLQNQVELTQASSFYDFNSEPDHAMKRMQRAKRNEAEEMERMTM